MLQQERPEILRRNHQCLDGVHRLDRGTAPPALEEAHLADEAPRLEIVVPPAHVDLGPAVEDDVHTVAPVPSLHDGLPRVEPHASPDLDHALEIVSFQVREERHGSERFQLRLVPRHLDRNPTAGPPR
jgi:hypothetical protein